MQSYHRSTAVRSRSSTPSRLYRGNTGAQGITNVVVLESLSSYGVGYFKKTSLFWPLRFKSHKPRRNPSFQCISQSPLLANMQDPPVLIWAPTMPVCALASLWADAARVFALDQDLVGHDRPVIHFQVCEAGLVAPHRN